VLPWPGAFIDHLDADIWSTRSETANPRTRDSPFIGSAIARVPESVARPLSWTGWWGRVTCQAGPATVAHAMAGGMDRNSSASVGAGQGETPEQAEPAPTPEKPGNVAHEQLCATADRTAGWAVQDSNHLA
jgi:hypothetical protein